jgi:probable F420-dependent oxidoreductase
MREPIEAALPFWLDHPDQEAKEIADEASRAGLTGLWIGEMVSFDAFALATAIGMRAPGLRLTLGPLPISVRTPVALALGTSSVASLTGCEVNLALGASSPTIVTGWHSREWSHSAARMRETIECLRQILRGDRADYDGRYVRSHGFRLRHRLPDTRIGVGPFGPNMIRLGAELADEVVLNLASPQRVTRVREQIDDYAAAMNRTPPHLTVWVPAAQRPGDASLRQMANQLSIYLGAPGYTEMFSELGFADLIERARSGERRSELAAAIPFELAEQLGAFGTPEHVAARLETYLHAGADTVAVVPATAEDPGGRAVLQTAADTCRLLPASPQEAS